VGLKGKKIFSFQKRKDAVFDRLRKRGGGGARHNYEEGKKDDPFSTDRSEGARRGIQKREITVALEKEKNIGGIESRLAGQRGGDSVVGPLLYHHSEKRRTSEPPEASAHCFEKRRRLAQTL